VTPGKPYGILHQGTGVILLPLVVLMASAAHMTYQLTLDPLTWDSVVAVGLFVLALLGTVARFWYRCTEPGRTYAMYFQQHPYFAPSGQSNRREKGVEIATKEQAELHVHIACKKAVSLGSCSFRLVDRQFRPRPFGLWRWNPASPRIAFVTNVWDADWEKRRQQPLRIDYKPSPTASPNDIGGYTVSYSEPLALLAGSPLWFRVIVDVRDSWRGHLEFEGPAPDGRHARTCRHVVLRKLRQ
jgi:hypothetical protein